jgi:hypothetical protein
MPFGKFVFMKTNNSIQQHPYGYCRYPIHYEEEPRIQHFGANGTYADSIPTDGEGILWLIH